MRDSVLEVEVDTPKDSNLYFPPIGEAVRGRLDFLRLSRRSVNAIQLSIPFPNGVPGQRIRVDLAEKRCSISEPLHDPEWGSAKKEIEKRGLPIPTAEETYPGAHVPDWLHAIRRAVEAGYVRIVRGELPRDLGEETKVPEVLDPADKKIDRLCTLVERLLDRLAPEVP